MSVLLTSLLTQRSWLVAPYIQGYVFDECGFSGDDYNMQSEGLYLLILEYVFICCVLAWPTCF